MRTTGSTSPRSTRPDPHPRRVLGAAMALVASCVVTAGVIRAIEASAVVGHPACSASEPEAGGAGDHAVDPRGGGCDDDRRAPLRQPRAWPHERAGVHVRSRAVVVTPPSPDEGATMTAIALAESGGS